MAIILSDGARPAIDIIKGSYEAPVGAWAHLGNPDIRQRLETAIRAVGRLDVAGHPTISWLGTAFVVGPNLLITGSLSLVLSREGEKLTFPSGVSLWVDFGHELLPDSSLRIQVEEVVYVDPKWSIQFVRAKIPDSITPLTLSTLTPDGLSGRELALIGYPAMDMRNDEAVMERIFRGVYDIKRLMPGKAIGSHVNTQQKIDLAHDCTSMGGTGSAPVIDLSTGHVVGVQYAGIYLDANYAAPTADLANIPALSDAGLRFYPKIRKTSAVPSKTSKTDGLALEAIIQRERPKLLAENWLAETTDPWRSVLESYKDRIDAAINSVGMLVINSAMGNWKCCAFLVGGKLALTAAIFDDNIVDGVGENVSLKSGTNAAIHFGENSVKIVAVKFLHPYFPVALLELEEAPDGTTPLELYSQMPAELAGRKVLLVSFAGDTKLTLQPGQALQMGESPDAERAATLFHDCNSVPGSAGAPLIDIGTGYVIGVHTRSLPTELRNYATPTWELARDPHVWRHEINLRPDPRPSWLNRWDTPASSIKSVPIEPRPAPNRWTVDTDVPIEWTKPEPRAMEILLRNLEPSAALRFAENVGFDITQIDQHQAPVDLLRKLVTRLALAARLRQFVEMVVNDNDYAGISGKLRKYL
jgi:hypothetical protein